MNKYAVEQFCRFVRESNEYRIYSFCLFIAGTKKQIDTISEVEYTLHPSFPNPVRVSVDKERAFPLQSEAWGGFPVYVRVFEESGGVSELEHFLSIEEASWPMGKKLDKLPDKAEKSIYEALFDPKWEWRKLSTLARRADLSIKETKEALARLELKKAVRKAAHTHFIDREELWGATSVVGLSPQPRP
jgi:transcription initiation factor IIF auxiliary subunit